MAHFDKKDKLDGEIDYELLNEDSINMYHKLEILQADTVTLLMKGYKIITLDCTTWKTEGDFHQDIAAKLEFPDYYGKNLDALNDCLRDISFDGCTGIVLVFKRVDVFFTQFPEEMPLAVFDILEKRSRNHLLLGNRLITILQTDDATLEVVGLGAGSAKWNNKEWSYKDRGVTPDDIKYYTYKR